MAIVSSIAKRALRLLSILQVGEEPSANEAVDILESFNAMLHGWDIDGVRINHADLEWTDTIPYEPNHLSPMAYMLAITIAPEYGRQAPPDVVEMARREYGNLRHYYANPQHFDLPDTPAENAENYY